MATWYDVARIVGELALTSEPSPHDWRVGKKLLAWERPLRPSEREALARTGAEPARATSSVSGWPTRASSSR
ncbi:hypothetical protein I549_2749 [Mycobacterium avium subsp. avium 2285 (R)]|nr:hypothetical protein I549_2749 [Mycobacterium avium subsp. avium 2285 (R)]